MFIRSSKLNYSIFNKEQIEKRMVDLRPAGASSCAVKCFHKLGINLFGEQTITWTITLDYFSTMKEGTYDLSVYRKVSKLELKESYEKIHTGNYSR